MKMLRTYICPPQKKTKNSLSTEHCEILGSYQQQPHQHNVFRAHFEAELHSQAEASKWQRTLCLIFRSKLTDSVVTYNTSLPCSTK